MQVLDKQIRVRIEKKGRGPRFTPNDFPDLRGKDAIWVALSWPIA